MPEDKLAAEEWAWEKIRAGEKADFNAEFGKLDPTKPDGWNNDRKIGAGFLRRIFFEKPYQGDRSGTALVVYPEMANANHYRSGPKRARRHRRQFP
jgi:hypothetical protein